MPTCGAFINPLDLECLFINTLSGSVMIFIAIAIIGIAMLAAFFKMRGFATLAMFGIFVILFFPILGAEFGDIYLIFALLIGIIVFRLAGRVIQR